MTHLSDFSYLERCTIWTYIAIYFGYSVYVGDKFKCLRFKSIASGELKSIVTILLIIMLMMQFMWDAASTFVKYTEGFVETTETGIISKPFELWTSKHQTLMMAMDYVECVTFSLQTGVLFLMQSFWNYLSNTYARKSFMGSLEFRFYILWALGSMAMFPILQWVYRNDVSKREGIPQLAYGCEALVAALLGVRSHFRFRRIIALSEKNNGASNKTVVTRLSYFKDMNMMITVILFSYAFSFIIICSDGLTEAKVINSNKFAMDTIIANVNICTVFILLLLVSIFHPRPQYTRDAGDTSLQEESKLAYTKSTNGRVSNYIQNDTRKNSDMDSKYMNTAVASNNHQNNNNNNGGFMRAMSPVTVDYPHSLTNDTEPLTRKPGSLSPPEPHAMYNSNKIHNMAIEDPYSNEHVMFSMMDMSKKQQQQQRYGLPHSITSTNSHDIPMHSATNRTGSPHHRYQDEDHYTDMSSAYEHTTSPTRTGRPSWERPHHVNELTPHPFGTDQQGEKMVRDWLWQSPERKNP